MSNLVNLAIGGAAGLVLLYVIIERIRVMNWHSHPWQVVAMHLFVALMLGSIAYAGLLDESIVGEIGYADDIRALGEAASVLVSALWMWASRRAFRAAQHGQPSRRSSDYMPLDAPYKVEPPEPLGQGQMRQVAGGQR